MECEKMEKNNSDQHEAPGSDLILAAPALGGGDNLTVREEGGDEPLIWSQGTEPIGPLSVITSDYESADSADGSPRPATDVSCDSEGDGQDFHFRPIGTAVVQVKVFEDGTHTQQLVDVVYQNVMYPPPPTMFPGVQPQEVPQPAECWVQPNHGIGSYAPGAFQAPPPPPPPYIYPPVTTAAPYVDNAAAMVPPAAPSYVDNAAAMVFPGPLQEQQVVRSEKQAEITLAPMPSVADGSDEMVGITHRFGPMVLFATAPTNASIPGKSIYSESVSRT